MVKDANRIAKNTKLPKSDRWNEAESRVRSSDNVKCLLHYKDLSFRLVEKILSISEAGENVLLLWV